MKDRSLVRAFSLIAHVDHGKSTLADRILQVCKAVPEREMREQYLDRMDLERERGITIKAQTLANLYLAIEAGLEVIPVVNKIDLPAADPERVSAELSSLIGVAPDSVLRVSGKTG